jgi:hypothetical protein
VRETDIENTLQAIVCVGLAGFIVLRRVSARQEAFGGIELSASLESRKDQLYFDVGCGISSFFPYW